MVESIRDVLLYEKRFEGRVVVMTMNRPAELNALGAGLSIAIAEGWMRFAADDEAWVGIITGAGRAFCAGADLKETSEVRAGRRPPSPPAPPIYPLADVLGLWKPTIAAINGFVLGGGFSVAQQCDIRIAAANAQIGIPEARWNMPAGWMHPLTRQMHLQHALEIALFGDAEGRLSAQRAYEIGWVNKVVPEGEALNEALRWAERCLYLAPQAVRNFKRILHRGFYMDPLAGRDFAAAVERNLVGMEDSIEGPRSFVEKRRPAFTGR